MDAELLKREFSSDPPQLGFVVPLVGFFHVGLGLGAEIGRQNGTLAGLDPETGVVGLIYEVFGGEFNTSTYAPSIYYSIGIRDQGYIQLWGSYEFIQTDGYKRGMVASTFGGGNRADFSVDSRELTLGAQTMYGLDAGRFGKALDARVAPAILDGNPRYGQAPLTAECWVRLDGKTRRNVILASDDSTSSSHWQLFTAKDSGRVGLFAPGLKPAELVAPLDLCDGQWHHLAMFLDGKSAKLVVDGKAVAEHGVELDLLF